MENINDKATNKLFFFALFYLVIDYGRPQDIIPIGVIRPGMIAVLLLMFFLASSKKIASAKSKQTKMIWFFIVLTSLYIPFAVNTHWAYLTTRTMLLYMPFILSVIICVDSVKRLKKLIIVFVCLMIYVALYGLLHGGKGSGNYFIDENDIALFINMWIPFCYFLFLHEKKMTTKIFFATGAVVGLSAIVVSFSRGGFVGLLCVIFVIWLVSPKKIVSVVLICIIASALYIFSGDAYKQEMSTVTDTKESTANSRLLSWQSGWNMFLDNPLGVGGNNFQYNFQDYQAEGFQRGMWGRAAHSLWFTLIPELGIVGIIIYFTLLFYNVKDILYIKKIDYTENDDLSYIHSLSIAFMAALAGFFASATFLSVLYYPHYWYLTAIIVATTRLSMKLRQEISKTSLETTSIIKI